ncbi:hypothetical protein [Alsobacter sp. SYSU BS001988]
MTFQDGVLGLNDGRHRFAWMRDRGARAVPVIIESPAEMVALISACGSTERKTSIEV